jgi:hypothetical protein
MADKFKYHNGKGALFVNNKHDVEHPNQPKWFLKMTGENGEEITAGVFPNKDFVEGGTKPEFTVSVNKRQPT